MEEKEEQKTNQPDILDYALTDEDMNEIVNGTYGGYNPYTDVDDTDMANDYNDGSDVATPSVVTPTTAPTATPTPSVATDPQAKTPEQTAYEQALANKQKVNEENAKSLRDLLDMYKPETPEEKAKRERMERTRQNIVGFSNMAAALGNLATAAGNGSYGRAVKVEPSSDDLDKAIQRERGIARERDAKGIELRNRYMALRKQMADDGVTSALQSYKLREQRDINNAKLAQAKAKQEADDAYRNAYLAFRIGKEANAEKRAQELINIKRAALKAKGAEDRKNYIPLPIKNGEETIRVNRYALQDPVIRGALEQLLPQSYFSTDDQTRLATARRDSNNALYEEVMMNYIGKYLIDGGIHLDDKATAEQKAAEIDRWNTMVKVLKAMEGDVVENADSRDVVDGLGSGKPKLFD